MLPRIRDFLRSASFRGIVIGTGVGVLLYLPLGGDGVRPENRFLFSGLLGGIDSPGLVDFLASLPYLSLVALGALVAGLVASEGGRDLRPGWAAVLLMGFVMAALVGSLLLWRGNPRLEIVPFLAIFLTFLLAVPWALVAWHLTSVGGRGVHAGGVVGLIVYVVLVTVLDPGLVWDPGQGRVLIYLAWLLLLWVVGLALIFGAIGGRLFVLLGR